jgi:addiction module antitoxin, relB/dinJ family
LICIGKSDTIDIQNKLRGNAMSQIAVRVDDKLKKEATEVFSELGLDMTTAVKLFLKQSVLTRSIPFELKLDSDYEIELEDGDYIRTRNIDEYNEVTQKAFKESISKYKNEGITKSTESVDDYFERMVRENA